MTSRLTDASAIEHRLLELAHTTDAKLTVAALAYFAPCSVEDASRVLDALASRDVLEMDVQDDGTILYELRGRQKLADARPPAPRAHTTALVPAVRPSAVPYASPSLAAIFSLFIPGAGHLYVGRAFAAVLWFVVVSAGYVLLLPGLILHLFSMVSAAGAATRQNLLPA